MSMIEVPALAGSSLMTTVDLGGLRTIGPDVEPAATEVCWRILSPKHGDLRITWDPANAAEVREARKTFERLIESGMTAYVCDSKGRATKDQMTEFDGAATQVIFAPKKLAVGG